ncbi:MAG: Fic family protein [Sedimentisphaerales bacterium]|nr:Fic family protein [Sedimentisphaerales bacterium]
MALSYNKLIRYDLLDDADQRLKESKKEFFFDFFSVCQEIGIADQFIRDCPSFPGSTKSIIKDELVSAIGSTLAIEGIMLKEEEIKKALETTPLEDKIRRKEQHAANSRDVYDYIQKEVLQGKSIGEFVYKEEHITTIHKLFTTNIASLGNQPGAYRNTSTSFGDPRKISLCQNYTDIYVSMKNYIEWLNTKKTGYLTSNPIAKAIMSHYYLTEIHPFGDGNGRTARAVEAMVLYEEAINPYCFWSLANFWNINRNEYITHLGNIRETCDPLDFIMWGAKGYLDEVIRIKERVLQKLKSLMLRDYVSWLLREKKHQPPEKRINQRIRDVVFLLTDLGKIPLDKFRASPQYESLYSNKSSKSRDFSKMKALDFIRISEVDGKKFIEPNYDVLERLRY